MKKIVLLSALLPALLFVSCNKEIEQTPAEPSQEEVTARFLALSPDTKTVFGEKNSADKYPVLWSATDKKVAYVLTTSTDLKTADLTPATDGTSAQIVVKGLAAASSYQFVFVSPQASLKSASKTNQTILLELPSAQTSTPDGPDEAAQLLYAVTGEITSLADEVPVSFAHAAAYFHISFKNVTLPAGATVQSVTIEAPEGCVLAGRNYFLPATGKYNGDGTSQFNMISVATSTTDEIWCGVVPVDLGGKSLKLIINTDKGTLTKTITLPATAKLELGDVAKFSVNMSGIAVSAPVEYQLVSSVDALHWGDKIIIASADADYAISYGQNTNNRSQAGITRVDDSILDPPSSVEIIQLEDGLVPGTWALKATVTEGYLYAAGTADKENYLRTKSVVDATASWSISFGNKTTGDEADPDSERAIIQASEPASLSNLIRYNAANSLFSAYAVTTSMGPVKIYRLKEDPVTVSRFKVLNENGTTDAISIPAKACEVPVYVLGNVSWTASVTGGATLDVSSGNGPSKLTLSVPANTGSSAVSYSVTVSTDQSVATGSYTISINQNAAVSSIQAGDVLLYETWAGGSANDTPSAYLAKSTATTQVFGDESVTYTQNGSSTKLYTDNLVYVKDGYTGSNPVPKNPNNLLVAKTSGYWKIDGIPCAGVKTAKLTYRSNSVANENRTVTTDTDGVTLGTVQSSSYTSDWEKKVNVLSYVISFSSSFAGDSFSLKFNNTGSSNIRITDVEVVVTEVY